MEHKDLMARNLRKALKRMRLAALADNVLYPQWCYVSIRENYGHEWEA